MNVCMQRKTNKELYAAKHQKHNKMEQLKHVRNELEILHRVCIIKNVSILDTLQTPCPIKIRTRKIYARGIYTQRGLPDPPPKFFNSEK